MANNQNITSFPLNVVNKEDCINVFESIVSKFNFSRVQKKSAVFDHKKLDWISSKYLTMQDNNDILKSIRKLNPDWGSDRDDSYCIKVISVLRSRCKSFIDIVISSEYFFSDPKILSNDNIKSIIKDPDKVIIKEIILLFNSLKSWDKGSLEKIFNIFLEKKTYSFGKVLKPLRFAICGSLNGPSLFELMEILGKDITINRLKTATKEFRFER